jgi:hypothetical protein
MFDMRRTRSCGLRLFAAYFLAMIVLGNSRRAGGREGNRQ